MIFQRMVVGLCLLSVGCGGAAVTGNNVLNPPPEQKAMAEAILQKHGVTDPILALQDRGGHWDATLAAPPKSDANDATMTSAPPIYRVYKDGRVDVPPRLPPATRK